jgi:antitoxin VapB
MALNIKNPDVDRLARELAALTGQNITDALLDALQEKVLKERERRGRKHVMKDILRIRERFNQLPTLDQRSEDEILGYDDKGLPS